MKLRRRISAGSSLISRAALSTSRSIRKFASGRPAPRYAPVAIKREACLVVLVAPHVRAEKFLGALGAPFHRASELPGGVTHEPVFRREAGFHAEAAADVADHHTKIFGFGSKKRREQLARARGRLV